MGLVDICAWAKFVILSSQGSFQGLLCGEPARWFRRSSALPRVRLLLGLVFDRALFEVLLPGHVSVDREFYTGRSP